MRRATATRPAPRRRPGCCRSRARAASRSRACGWPPRVYIVMTAPNTAPTPIRTAMMPPIVRMISLQRLRSARRSSRCSRIAVTVQLRVRGQPVLELPGTTSGDVEPRVDRLIAVAAAVAPCSTRASHQISDSDDARRRPRRCRRPVQRVLAPRQRRADGRARRTAAPRRGRR